MAGWQVNTFSYQLIVNYLVPKDRCALGKYYFQNVHLNVMLFLVFTKSLDSVILLKT